MAEKSFHVEVVSADAEEILSDITVTNDAGQVLVVIDD